jgi:hypothetical protein
MLPAASQAAHRLCSERLTLEEVAEVFAYGERWVGDEYGG